jgi:hypothetical protein
MSVWFCIPSARPAAEANLALNKWRECGYRIALWRDSSENVPICDLLLTGSYPGYALAVNALVKEVLARDLQCLWVVIGGDDTLPDPNHSPEDIATDCALHFSGTFGVMQPTGDRWADGSIDRICGSPWLGREFCERMYGGNGPLFSEYFHMFVDQELWEIATKLGVLWQRRDLTHLHNHFCRVDNAVNWQQGRAKMPEFLREANSPEHWRKYKALFEARKATGFPGHQPIPEKVCA